MAADTGVTLVPGKVTALEDYRTVMAQRGALPGNRVDGSPGFHNPFDRQIFRTGVEEFQKRKVPDVWPHRVGSGSCSSSALHV